MAYLKHISLLCNESQNAANPFTTDMLYVRGVCLFFKYILQVIVRRSTKHTECVDQMKLSWNWV